MLRAKRSFFEGAKVKKHLVVIACERMNFMILSKRASYNGGGGTQQYYFQKK
jgi:hypothetical protein